MVANVLCRRYLIFYQQEDLMKNNIYENAQGILKDDNKLKEFAELNRFTAE